MDHVHGNSRFRQYSTLLCLQIFLCITYSCISQKDETIFKSYDHSLVPYSFYQPQESQVLPSELREISGLSCISTGILAAVEDETGNVYLLNRSGEITKKIRFGKPGDYEGIELLSDTYYVIQSNGDLTSFRIVNNEAIDRNTIDTEFSRRNDIEGLGELNGRLLIACKASGEINENGVDEKAIYLLNEKLEPGKDPLFTIDKEEIESHIRKRLPEVRIHEFDPSGVARHPVSGNFYVLSADHILCVFSPEGNLAEVILLDKRIYRQPEGICFWQNGDLVISSEGDGKKGMLFFLPLK